MPVTPPGMLTDVKPEQPLNALVPMLVTPMGMVVFLQPAISVFPSLDKRALHWLLFASVDLYAVLPASTVIVSNIKHILNAPDSMLVTFLGMLTDVTKQDWNA